jgi:ATP-dependent proteinase. Serine peptidase. MEROPS family S16
MVIPLFVGRVKSIAALERAMTEDKQILLVAQKHASVDEPSIDDLYQFATIATVLQLLKLPDGTVKVLVEGRQRAQINAIEEEEDFFMAEISVIARDEAEGREVDVLTRSLISRFEQYVNLSKKVPSEVMTSLSGIDDPGRLADTVAAHMSLELAQKQEILEVSDVRERLEHLIGLMEAEADLYQVEKKIRGRVKKQMEKSQREYYLNEQMKAIQKELGEMGEEVSEAEELEKKIVEAGMSKEAESKVKAELSNLSSCRPCLPKPRWFVPISIGW